MDRELLYMSPAEFSKAILGQKKTGSGKAISFDRTSLRKKARVLRRGEIAQAGSEDDYAENLSKDDQAEIDAIKGKSGFKSESTRKANKKKEIMERRRKEYAENSETSAQLLKDIDINTELVRQDTLSGEMLEQMAGHIGRMASVKEAFLQSGDKESAELANKISFDIEQIMQFARLNFEADGEPSYEKKMFKLIKLYSALYDHCAQLIKRTEGDTKTEITELQEMYNAQAIRIDAEAERSAGKGEKTKWATIMQRAQGIKIKERNTEEGEKVTGGMASEVKKVTRKNGKGKLYFKKKEVLVAESERFRESIKAILDQTSPEYALILGLANDPEFYRAYLQEKKRWFGANEEYLDIENGEDVRYIDKMSNWFDDHYKGDVEFNDPKAFGNVAKKHVMMSGIYESNYKSDMGVKEGSDISKRNFAAQRMASLFGMGGLITHNELITYKEKGEKGKESLSEGFAMKDAKGLGAYDLRDFIADNGVEEFVMTSAAIGQLSKLQFLDSIIGQTDRHINNIVLQYTYDPNDRSVKITGIVGIDNDMTFGTKFNFNENMSGNTIGAIIRQEGQYQLKDKYVDKGMYDAFKNMRVEDIKAALTGLIDEEYIEATIARFVLIKSVMVGKEGFKTDASGKSRESDFEKYAGLVEKYCEDEDQKGEFMAQMRRNSHAKDGGKPKFKVLEEKKWGSQKVKQGLTESNDYSIDDRNYYKSICDELNKGIQDGIQNWNWNHKKKK